MDFKAFSGLKDISRKDGKIEKRALQSLNPTQLNRLKSHMTYKFRESSLCALRLEDCLNNIYWGPANKEKHENISLVTWLNSLQYMYSTILKQSYIVPGTDSEPVGPRFVHIYTKYYFLKIISQYHTFKVCSVYCYNNGLRNHFSWPYGGRNSKSPQPEHNVGTKSDPVLDDPRTIANWFASDDVIL